MTDHEAVARTDVGPHRDVNEDAVYAADGESWWLLAVADGMGGHVGGEVASEAAIEAFTDHVEPKLDRREGEERGPLLTEGISGANSRLHELVEEDSALEGMGTTFVAALVEGQTASVVNVGDSRAYHVTDSGIEQVTVDQSLVQELLDEGSISESEVAEHPYSNVVSQALGTTETLDPDTYEISLTGTLLLCSDGLSDVVSDAELEEICRSDREFDDVADECIHRAKANGTEDNVSLVALR